MISIFWSSSSWVFYSLSLFGAILYEDLEKGAAPRAKSMQKFTSLIRACQGFLRGKHL